MSGAPDEPALPKGHPARLDYDANSPEAKAWHEHQRSLESSSGHPPGYNPDLTKPHGGLGWVLGEDPQHPEREPFTGHVRKTLQAEEWQPGMPDRRKGASAGSGAGTENTANQPQ
jgi:hypothetical protein